MIEPAIMREEGESIPEGVSYSETSKSYFLFVKNGTKIFSVRVRKPDLHYSTPEVHNCD